LMYWRPYIDYLIALAILAPWGVGQVSPNRVVYPRLPLSFESNQGQADRRVKYLSRGRGYTLLLSANQAVLRSPHNAVAMKLLGANPSPKITGLKELPGKSNYFIGKDPAAWRTNVPNYSQVEYSDVYPGVSLVFYGNQ